MYILGDLEKNLITHEENEDSGYEDFDLTTTHSHSKTSGSSRFDNNKKRKIKDLDQPHVVAKQKRSTKGNDQLVSLRAPCTHIYRPNQYHRVLFVY